MKRLLLILTPFFLSALPYELNFVGLKDDAALKAMFDVSDLVTLQDRPPASINGLRYRINGDIPDLINVLHAFGYYDAAITSDVTLEKHAVQVYLYIHPGPQYKLSSYEVFNQECTTLATSIPSCGTFTPEKLGLKLGAPALSIDIVNAELTLLTELARCGYPLASVEKRRIIVDMQDKVVEAAACIDEGPQAQFGPLSIHGLKSVKPCFIFRRLDWREGEIYSPDEVEQTQKSLLDSGLFSSVMISHESQLDEMGQLPLKMRLTESKHKQVSLGVFYATVDGPGATFAWTNRNLRGMGEILSIDGEFSGRYLSGTVTYKKPDFFFLDQTYRILGQIERVRIHAYTALTYKGANYIDKKLDTRRNLSVGLEIEQIDVTNSASNGNYLLIALPVFAKYNTADDLMNPTKGYSITYQAQLFQSLENGYQRFAKQRLTTTFYIPLWSKWFVFATRAQFGSIAGTRQKNVPLPILFLGGSEDDLRGYRYMTVSPLNSHNKPYGGRSAVFLTGELRIRFTETLGIVPFADFGTVTFSELPELDAKWYKSAGIGLRYYTFFGPLRADIGFPLDRRESIDPPFRIYASIGQTF
ncbi:MAG: hypothetical protein COT85_01730 [Chlamydiae bacterium CG10_big_fil_rev_8_21_14_0_10_42_34]|nr:MAG: hypothetical protein COT85_01730 [Chlamydiae bacterium CG10_big_fil_rev_8_21_14_0_10_42_34]